MCFPPSTACTGLFGELLISCCCCKLSFNLILITITACILPVPEVILRFPIFVNQGHCLPPSDGELSRLTLNETQKVMLFWMVILTIEFLGGKYSTFVQANVVLFAHWLIQLCVNLDISHLKHKMM